MMVSLAAARRGIDHDSIILDGGGIVAAGGSGSYDTISIGDGNGDEVSVRGDSSYDTITLGDGFFDRVSVVGNTDHDTIIVGNGPGDTITLNSNLSGTATGGDTIITGTGASDSVTVAAHTNADTFGFFAGDLNIENNSQFTTITGAQAGDQVAVGNSAGLVLSGADSLGSTPMQTSTTDTTVHPVTGDADDR
jgi:hypothetical protein